MNRRALKTVRSPLPLAERDFVSFFLQAPALERERGRKDTFHLPNFVNDRITPRLFETLKYQRKKIFYQYNCSITHLWVGANFTCGAHLSQLNERYLVVHLQN